MSGSLDLLGLALVHDDLGGMDYASLGDDYYAFGDDEDDDDLGGYEDFGDDEDDDDLGARKRRARKGSKKSGGRKPASRPVNRPVARRPAVQQIVQKTILTGISANVTGNAQGTVTIRPQFDFVAEDVTFTGSTNGTSGLGVAGAWTVRTVQFGDRIIFSNNIGVPIAIFAVAGFMRGLVKGAAIAAGLDILITANLTNAVAVPTTTGGPGQLIASFTGLKRGTTGCGPGAV